MPVLNGAEAMRIVRLQDIFPRPDLPVILLSDQARCSYILDVLRLDAHEFLLKPTSPKAGEGSFGVDHR
jgi:CheY-like chemotaxis protein